MKISIASDHAGFKLKTQLVEKLEKEYKIIDFGCFSEESCDYPDYATKVAKSVQNKDVDRGILICGSGIGMAIVANKFRGIRAGVCFSEETARLLAEHNFANIICFPARVKVCGEIVNVEQLFLWTKIWLETPNSVQERHINRIKKISEIEKENFKK
jgi:ribose 5-phosphate isomerase B